MFIAKYHIAPVLPYVGLSELTTALVSFRQSRGFPLFKCTQISTVHCSLDCLVTHIGDLLSLELPFDHSTRTVSFPPHFLPPSAPHPLKSFLGLPARSASSTEPESLHFDKQRVINPRSKPVVRRIAAVVRPCLWKEITAQRSSGGLRHMRFSRKKSSARVGQESVQRVWSGWWRRK